MSMCVYVYRTVHICALALRVQKVVLDLLELELELPYVSTEKKTWVLIGAICVLNH